MIDTGYIGPPGKPRPRPPARPAPPSPPGPPDVTWSDPVATTPSWLKPAGIGCAAALVPLIVLAALFMALLSYRTTPDDPAPRPTGNAVAKGRTFVPILAGSLADAFDKAAEALEADKTAAEANKALKDSFDAGRRHAFAEHAGPTFSSLVPPGTEPADDATRKAFARMHRDFARGLRGGSR